MELLEFCSGLFVVLLLYWFGGLLLDDTPHRPIQQEIIKKESEEE